VGTAAAIRVCALRPHIKLMIAPDICNVVVDSKAPAAPADSEPRKTEEAGDDTQQGGVGECTTYVI
jgi:hypothetical protein